MVVTMPFMAWPILQVGCGLCGLAGFMELTLRLAQGFVRKSCEADEPLFRPDQGTKSSSSTA